MEFHMQFPRPLDSRMFSEDAPDPAVNRYHALQRSVIISLQCTSPPARKPLPRKIETSFFFKREAQRIASNASPGLLVLLPPPPTHRHLHPTGDEGVLALF